ncbi:MAG: FAD-dependent oxidoreductase [Pseudanabaenaceae cyanobacterium SKYGB_i_bin29]|nr:FAD-dependent oxidoreductase [Pseudanabaenaceae cyanobacterium SKYG29]MDW8420307.1 FAD-dependent oxidoreductase [Pseudanabaenaceae cyanobacterium SKYGB_i_bin29]
MKEVVIVGAGMAGLACGVRLRQAGISATILEKSAGVGGRVATRRAQGTWLDHGLPCVTRGTDPRYNAWVESLISRGILQRWTDRRFLLSVHGLANQQEDSPFFASPQGITAIAKDLAQDQKIHLNTKVKEIKVNNDRWQLFTDKGEFWADVLVMTPPAPQSHDLLAYALSFHPEVLSSLATAVYQSTITLLCGYHSQRLLPSDWEILECRDHQVIQYLYYNSTKQATPPYPSLVIHSTPDFALAHQGAADLGKVGELMLEELGHLLTSQMAKPDWWQVHRWRYSRVKQALEVPSLASYRPLPLFLAGDWLAGQGIESAFLSGIHAAEEIISARIL